MALLSENQVILTRAVIGKYMKIITKFGIVRKRDNLRKFDHRDNIHHQGRIFIDKWRRSEFNCNKLSVNIKCRKTFNLYF